MSAIDYILFQDRYKGNVVKIEKLEIDSNISDHIPLMLSLKCDISYKKMKEHTNAKSSKVNWNKVDKNEYKTLLNEKLEKIKPISEKLNLDQAFEELTKIISDTTVKIAPRKRKGKKKKKLPLMNEEIIQAVKRKKTAFFVWKQHGRPKEPGNFYLKENNHHI
ncbi:unnamed protein product [Mytilus coruscus]|uniref:Endonuclease/exonuclease/phosphatase domain-containing protein n=1 Tax=Mytilus coruscus TaxID=42192 RepID=A0A6J8DTY3_MYTCO|nr:unnamed protein product [Mytilus coruscus]